MLEIARKRRSSSDNVHCFSIRISPCNVGKLASCLSVHSSYAFAISSIFVSAYKTEMGRRLGVFRSF